MPQLSTELLDIEYRDEGPANAPVALLLHGWPDNASTWDGVAPRLVSTGWRVVVPTLRGFGGTRFRRDETPRTGNAPMLAIDAIELLDGLGIDRVVVAGHDWGSNIAEPLAVGWPDRVGRMAMLASPPRMGGNPTPPFWHAELEWYHWFMATARGAAAVREDRRGFARRHWDNWSPAGWYEEATFARVAAAWDNPDWVDITLHSYRSRWNEAQPDPSSLWLEDRLKATGRLSLPALYLHGEVDGVNPPATADKVPDRFDGAFTKVMLPGVGHFPQREAPGAVADALIDLFGYPLSRRAL